VDLDFLLHNTSPHPSLHTLISMAPSAISTGLGKLQETLNGSIEGRKIADLHKNMKDYNVPKNRLTTDYGVKQENTGAFQCS